MISFFRRKSLLRILGLCFFLFSAAYMIYQQRNVSYDVYAVDLLHREKKLQVLVDLGVELAKQEKYDELEKILQSERETFGIDWYLVK